MSADSPRASVVDVIQNYLGCEISEKTGRQLRSLSVSQVSELVSLLDKFLYDTTKAAAWSEGAVLADDGTLGYLWDNSLGESPEVLSDQMKQLALYYPEVLMPWGTISDAYAFEGIKPVSTIIDYIYCNRRLIEAHVLTPVAHDDSKEHQYAVLYPIYDLAMANATDTFARYAKKHMPMIDGLPLWEYRKSLRCYLLSLYESLYVAGKLGANPAFLDYSTDRLMLYHLRHPLYVPASHNSAEVATAHTLVSIEVPRLSKISADDLASLRSDVESFESWRQDFGSVLRMTARDLNQVDDLGQVFSDHCIILKERARSLDKELSRGSLKNRLSKAGSTLSIGALSAAASQSVIGTLGLSNSLLVDLVKLGPAAAISVLWWLLLGSPGRDRKVLLRFYQSLFPEDPK